TARRSHGYKMLRLLRSLFRVRPESTAPKRSTSGMYCDRFFSSIEYLPHNDGKNQMSTPVQRYQKSGSVLAYTSNPKCFVLFHLHSPLLRFALPMSPGPTNNLPDTYIGWSYLIPPIGCYT